MKPGDLLLLSMKDLQGLNISMKDVIELMRTVLKEHGLRRYVMPSKTVIRVEGRFEAMVGALPEIKSVGMKWSARFIRNREHGLPTLTAVIVVNDPNRGLPIAFMDGTYLLALRTPAVTAVAAEYLARDKAERLGVVGAGLQGRQHAKAMPLTVKGLKEIFVYDVLSDAAYAFKKEVETETGLEVRILGSVEEVVKGSDVLVTATAGVKEPIIRGEWLKPGSFATTIEGDPVWDHEAPRIADKLVVDNWEQCKEGGQFGELAKKCLIKPYAELGEIVVGLKKGREDPKERIFMWVRGMATEDVALAKAVYELALKKGIGKVFNIIG